VPVNFVPYQSPFFPSATTTTTGGYLPSRIITRGNLPEQELLEREVEQQGFVISDGRRRRTASPRSTIPSTRRRSTICVNIRKTPIPK
jgi:hypothetical protein